MSPAHPDGAAAMIAPDVAAVLASYDPEIRTELLAVRQLILVAAAETPTVGAIEEALRWGQPAYLTSDTRSGSTLRLAPTSPTSEGDYAMYVICHTHLIDSFRSAFGDVFAYDGNRGLVFWLGQERPEDELRACIKMALTYHSACR